MPPVDTGQTEGSPTTPPCATSEMSGTAPEQPAGERVKSGGTNPVPDQTACRGAEPAAITAGPVPLYLVPQTISAEIHAHGGAISGITVRRTGQHVYAISLTTVPKQAPKPAPEPGAGQAGGDTGAA